MAPRRISAVNTAVDSENKIHQDAVAASYGFRGGLVPGVTVYGYLASAAIEELGIDWLAKGSMDVRFLAPVYQGEDGDVTVTRDAGGHTVVNIGSRAIGNAWIGNFPPPNAAGYAERPIARCLPSAESLAPGTILGTLVRRLDLATARMSAPLDAAIGLGRLAQPAILLALVNEMFVANYELGPWIHIASEVRNFETARDGDEMRVRGRIEDRYERKGHEFVVLDCVIVNAAGRVVEQVRHTAIWQPRKNR